MNIEIKNVKKIGRKYIVEYDKIPYIDISSVYLANKTSFIKYIYASTTVSWAN